MSSGFESPVGALNFPCQHCGASIQASSGNVGQSISCPHCGAVQPVSRPIHPGEQQTGGDTPTVVPSTRDATTGVPPTDAAAIVISEDEVQTPGQTGTNEMVRIDAVSTPQPPASEPATSRSTPTKQLFEDISRELAKVFVGQEELVLGTLVALFSSGHVLIESVPGLGKTLFIRALGKILGCQFGRIQFTADLMPSDITGAPIFNMKTQEFKFRPGPVFTQLLLADEINRSPAKTHAALLEIMQEYRVTIDGNSHEIERPFLVLATQNPIESEGTYNLPEAQLDRFMFKLRVDYPDREEEARILDMHSRQLNLDDQLEALQTIASPEKIMQITHDNNQVRVDPKLLNYVNEVVRTTRTWPQFYLGASPRAGLALMQAARTFAAFQGRDYAVPDDVAEMTLPALRHRVILTAEAEVEGRTVDDLLKEMLRNVEVPRL